LEQPKELNKDKPLPPPPPTPPPPEIKTIKVLPPKVEPDEKVVEDPPTKEEMQKTAISDKTKDGADDPNGNVTGTNDKLPEPEPVPEPPKEEKVELIVDEQAAYSSDHKAFFQRNFNKPRLAQANGIGGKFQVRITVDKEGRMVDKKVVDMKKVDIIDPATGEVYGFVKEINRVLDLMAKEGSFVPAKKGGKPVKAVLKFDLNFQVE
jgi:periplasmic protein TonB